ncbi:hypothetical protein BDN67DRAFT_608432 [Paxillus ammoniavirescens]|nr:hypothetical protein BDN67DRAFT_608432 [Paxillus ammoniavirescens]
MDSESIDPVHRGSYPGGTLAHIYPSRCIPAGPASHTHERTRCRTLLGRIHTWPCVRGQVRMGICFEKSVCPFAQPKLICLSCSRNRLTHSRVDTTGVKKSQRHFSCSEPLLRIIIRLPAIVYINCHRPFAQCSGKAHRRPLQSHHLINRSCSFIDITTLLALPLVTLYLPLSEQ